ncbi:MAG: GNAT family N-acetyltransferase [Bacteriovoracaceae bacterium]|nr:GNAT family N-acetyltransferase [Bacteriovoracaceae bacterium]
MKNTNKQKDFQVRNLIIDDSNSFINLMNKFYEYSGGKQETEQSIMPLFEKALNPTANLHFLVAVQDSNLIGMISLTFAESSYKVSPFAYGDDFYVVDEKRGAGVGNALIEGAKKEAIKHNCSNILVGVGNDESDAISFYKKNKFFDMECKLMTLPL